MVHDIVAAVNKLQCLVAHHYLECALHHGLGHSGTGDPLLIYCFINSRLRLMFLRGTAPVFVWLLLPVQS